MAAPLLASPDTSKGVTLIASLIAY